MKSRKFVSLSISLFFILVMLVTGWTNYKNGDMSSTCSVSIDVTLPGDQNCTNVTVIAKHMVSNTNYVLTKSGCTYTGNGLLCGKYTVYACNADYYGTTSVSTKTDGITDGIIMMQGGECPIVE